jgi:enoyl reductase-like protein
MAGDAVGGEDHTLCRVRAVHQLERVQLTVVSEKTHPATEQQRMDHQSELVDEVVRHQGPNQSAASHDQEVTVTLPLSFATAPGTSPVSRVEFGQSSAVDAFREATYFLAPFNASLNGPPTASFSALMKGPNGRFLTRPLGKTHCQLRSNV